MEIRKLSHPEINIAIDFLQAMLGEMAFFGGHELQDSHTIASWYREHICSYIAVPEHLFLVVERQASSNQLIGILEASISELHPVFRPKSSLHIHAIYVLPEQRRSGVARSLLKTAFTWGRENGCTEVDLNVLRNSPARSLYESLAFEPFEIEMRRNL